MGAEEDFWAQKKKIQLCLNVPMCLNNSKLLYFPNIFNDQKWQPGMKWIVQLQNTKNAQSRWVIAPKLMCVE